MTRWVLTNVFCHVMPPRSSHVTFPSSSGPVSVFPPSGSWQQLICFYHCSFIFSGISYKWIHTVYRQYKVFQYVALPLSIKFWDTSMLVCVSLVTPFTLRSISLYGYSTDLLAVDRCWVVSSFWLLQIKLLGTCAYKSLGGHMI